MMLRNQRVQPTDSDPQPKWFNSPVTYHNGNLTDIRNHIPVFERHGFGLAQADNQLSKPNKRLDTIVRRPFGDDKAFVPVGVVSKDYALVNHGAVLGVVITAFEDAKIAPADVKAELKITEYGERMALSLSLPDKYHLDPGDGYPMALRLECLNSVDGSTRFRVLMSWLRLVCSNGLVIGVTHSDVRRRHIGDLGVARVGAVLTSGLRESKAEKKNFESWRRAEVTLNRIVPWVDKDLRKEWGFKAAARTFHIARFGYDADVAGQYKGNTPTTIAMQKTKRVPGAPDECRNLFDLSQVLAWLAKERRDVQDQLEWREKIPELLAHLRN
jgi:hypothetical protein